RRSSDLTAARTAAAASSAASAEPQIVDPEIELRRVRSLEQEARHLGAVEVRRGAPPLLRELPPAEPGPARSDGHPEVVAVARRRDGRHLHPHPVATAGERDPVEGAQIDGRREAHADQRVPPAVRLAERKAASRRPRATPGALGLEREGLTGAL